MSIKCRGQVQLTLERHKNVKKSTQTRARSKLQFDDSYLAQTIIISRKNQSQVSCKHIPVLIVHLIPLNDPQ